MKLKYRVSIDNTELYIPTSIDKDDFEQVKKYVLRLRSEHPAKNIELWEITSRLVEL
jgi:hypothetical protein